MKAFFLAFKWTKVYQYNHKFLKNKLVAQAIAKTPGILGNLLNREEEMTAPNVMNSFSGARGTLVAGLTALALAFTPAAFADHGVAHPSTYSQQNVAVATQQCAPSEAEFLFNRVDVRGQSEAGIVTAASASSKNGVSVVLYTTNKEVWRIAYLAAEERGRLGCPTTLVLAANGQDKIEIWAAGQFAGEIKNPSVTSGRLGPLIHEGMDHASSLGLGNTQVSLGFVPRQN